MGYRENVQALCDHIGVANPIQEDVLTLEAITFHSVDSSTARIEGTDMNRAGRLFFQDYTGGKQWIPPMKISKEFHEYAAQFFAENWLDAETAGRTMLTAFKNATHVEYHWK
ncbi:MAG: hypothetical protein RL538_398 [Candidatus Parcubacteria bacterium]|jgi:hypothetical protein